MNLSPEYPQTIHEAVPPKIIKMVNQETEPTVMETPEKPKRSKKRETPEAGRRMAAFGFRLTGVRSSTENVSIRGTDRPEGRKEHSRSIPENLPHDRKGQ